jgi:hypothetical protein
LGIALAFGVRARRPAARLAIADAPPGSLREDGAVSRPRAREGANGHGGTGPDPAHPTICVPELAGSDAWSPPPNSSPDRWWMREALSDAEHPAETAYGFSDGLIASFGCLLERSRRRHAAEEQVAKELRNLALGHWLVERDVLLGGGRVPFVIVGPTGIALLAVTDGQWEVSDIVRLARLGAHMRARLESYEGRTHAGICLAFDRMPPRAWYGGVDDRGRGGWILGANWLLPWLYGLPTGQGADVDDIQALNAVAEPDWTRRSTARLPEIQRFG